MKKIAFIAHSINKKGGIERVINLKMEALSKSYKCNLILMFNIGKFAYKFNNESDIFILNEKVKKVKDILVNNLISLRKYIKENNIKVLIIEGRPVPFIPLLLRFFLNINIKIIFCDHGSLKGYEITAKSSSIKKQICNFIDQFLIIHLSNKIIVLTNKTKEEYIKQLNVNDNKISVIPNILDNNLFSNLQKYNLKSQKIITVGRIDYQKGYEYLIKVAKLIFVKHQDWQWHIYGDGDIEYKNKIINLIKENNLEKHIVLKGNRSDIYDLYQDYSFYVMTSRYEGLPMVLLEAKAKKLPLISFDINSGPSDIIRDGIDGFLIKAFDCEAMADKICELIENPELRQRLSDNAHGNLDKFTKEKIIKQWCDLIESLY